MTTHLQSATNPPSARKLRRAGAVLAASTPILGFIVYAMTATIVGEHRLEGTAGLTPLGWLSVASPALLGLALIALSFVAPDAHVPGRQAIGTTSIALAFVLLGLGLFSLMTAQPGDASIGGGLLVLASLLATAVGVFIKAAPPKQPR